MAATTAESVAPLVVVPVTELSLTDDERVEISAAWLNDVLSIRWKRFRDESEPGSPDTSD